MTSIHCFLKYQRQRALASACVGAGGGLGDNGIAEPVAPLISVGDSVVDGIVPLPEPQIAAPNLQGLDTPPNDSQESVGGVGTVSSGRAGEKRVSFAVLPMPARGDTDSRNGYISSLADYPLELDHTPRTFARVAGTDSHPLHWYLIMLTSGC